VTNATRAERELMESYQKLKQLVDEVAEDVYKAIGGNKAAGTRVRKAMQEIKNTAQEVRKRVLEIRESEESQP
jgi:uncharacterized protein YktA (UPF0223 family)